MKLRTKWVVLWSLWAARLVMQPTPPVLVSNGWLRGSLSHDGSHLQYLAIPYATVVKRFQAPGPEPSWNGVFDAVEEYIRCTQELYDGAPITTGQENCLVLNVYSPLNRPMDKALPVMVNIHGGGFYANSGSRMTFGPGFLMKKEIVLVTINYRLYIEGFVCLGIKEAPGNAGMKDQVAALKWIKKNIRAFGGDPDNVTIFGESSGGSAVSYHMLSPMSKGLFHKAISQSGSAISPIAFQYDPVYAAYLFAKQMGFNSQDPIELYKYLMNQSNSDLALLRIPRQEGQTIFSEVLFCPCAESVFEGEEQFITELPYDMLLKGKFNKVPIIVGSNLQEGLFFVGIDKKIDRVDIEKALPNDLFFPSKQERQEVADKAKVMYMGNDEGLFQMQTKLNKMYGDPFLSYPALEETELFTKHNDQPVYSYLFGYEGQRNLMKAFLSDELKAISGATHGDEMLYIFRMDFIPVISDFDMIDKITNLWTNFAKYGNPTPEVSELIPVKWHPVTKEDPKTFLIDKQFGTLPLWYNESLLFWKEVYSKYRRKL